MPPARATSLAARLSHLFETIRPEAGKEFSYKHVADAIRHNQGVSISHTYIWSLRTGKQDNPTLKQLEAIAQFFGVPTEYFLSDTRAERVNQQLAVLAAMRDVGVQKVALRASGLSDGALESITKMIEVARSLEGLDKEAEKGRG
ncbi:helix-turn-helix domain-containing protein [Actinoplanes aureus]|uniref:XRE family transcriptional regulator n=1 Tax=Actinoplanes aureus TaxID=2792083 RepID=A0A931G2C2_9ACTN|nr:XRE family transcriptional regulator [Actinoplanes aureus]MBG0567552.1 XRE family transcriptional regulator [Actinoplanes aureus]